MVPEDGVVLVAQSQVTENTNQGLRRGAKGAARATCSMINLLLESTLNNVVLVHTLYLYIVDHPDRMLGTDLTGFMDRQLCSGLVDTHTRTRTHLQCGPTKLQLENSNQHWDPVVLTDGVLCRLSTGVSAGDVPEGAEDRLNDLLSPAHRADGAEEGLEGGGEGGRQREGGRSMHQASGATATTAHHTHPAHPSLLTSTPCSWQTMVLFLALLHVRLERTPAVQVTILTS